MKDCSYLCSVLKSKKKGMSKKGLRPNVMAIPSRKVKREGENGKNVEVQLYKIVPIGAYRR